MESIPDRIGYEYGIWNIIAYDMIATYQVITISKLKAVSVQDKKLVAATEII